MNENILEQYDNGLSINQIAKNNNTSIHLDRKFDIFCQLRSRHTEKYGVDNSVNSGDILI